MLSILYGTTSHSTSRIGLTHTQPLLAYFLIRSLISRLDPEAQQKEEARAKASAATRRLDAILNKARDDESDDDDYESGGRRRRRRKEDLVLTPYEQTIAMEVVAPEEIPVSFDGMLDIQSYLFLGLFSKTLVELRL